MYKINAFRSLSTLVAFIQEASLPSQKLILGKLGNITQKAEATHFTSRGMIIVGKVVGLHPDFSDVLSTFLPLENGILSHDTGTCYFIVTRTNAWTCALAFRAVALFIYIFSDLCQNKNHLSEKKSNTLVVLRINFLTI